MDKPWLSFIVPFCSLFIGLGAWLMSMAGGKILEGVKARDWQQTTGRLLSVQSEDTSSSDSSSREIRVRYIYNVNGREYEGKTVHPAYTGSSFESTHRGLEKILKPGTHVRVHHHPMHPERSTISVGFFSSSLAMFFGGFLFFAAGVGFLLTFWFALAGNQDIASGITIIR